MIPALNEERHIQRCIQSIRDNVPSGVSYEVLVGDHGSSDATAMRAQCEGARVYSIGRCTVGELRNRLVTYAQGRVLVFIDADCRLTDGWRQKIETVLGSLELEPRQLTGSKCVPPPDGGFVCRYWFQPLAATPTSYIGTGHMVVPVVTFSSLGGFDPMLESGEDYEFCVRAKSAGVAVVPDPALLVIHDGFPSTIGAFVRREAWHGSGDLNSVAAFLNSRVAVASVLFVSVQFAALFLSLIAPALAIGLGVLLLAVLYLASVAKFGPLRVVSRIANMTIMYFYFAGRFLALFPWLARRRQFTREAA